MRRGGVRKEENVEERERGDLPRVVASITLLTAIWPLMIVHTFPVLSLIDPPDPATTTVPEGDGVGAGVGYM